VAGIVVQSSEGVRSWTLSGVWKYDEGYSEKFRERSEEVTQWEEEVDEIRGIDVEECVGVEYLGEDIWIWGGFQDEEWELEGRRVISRCDFV